MGPIAGQSVGEGEKEEGPGARPMAAEQRGKEKEIPKKR